MAATYGVDVKILEHDEPDGRRIIVPMLNKG